MEMRSFITTVLLALLCFGAGVSKASTSGPDSAYVIVTDARGGSGHDSYVAVVEELAKLRTATAILNLNDMPLEEVFRRLRELKPHYVAFVLHPEKIEDNFVGAVFQGLTAFNDDPYLDCAAGYITGATAQDALKLVRATAAAQARPARDSKRFVAIAHTFAQNDLAPFAFQQTARYRTYGYGTAEINPIDNSAAWQGKADRELQKLDEASLVFLAGHGMGDTSCAIGGDAFGRVRLKAAIIVNGTCHSAVTSVRHDSTDRFWTIKTTRIDPGKSVCLNFIKAGAISQIASTASSSWSNVAYSISGFFDQGKSMGEALQESLNGKIREGGIKSIHIIPFADGHRSPQALGAEENPGGIQSIARVILIGDPAYRPFPKGARGPAWAASTHEYLRLSPEDERVRQLVDGLSDPRAPRFKALNDLIAVGRPAVPLLIEEMRTSSNWQVPKALGAIGDERAIAPLIEKLAQCRQPPLSDVVAEALRRLTSKDFSTDAAAWRAWWQEKNKPGGSPGL